MELNNSNTFIHMKPCKKSKDYLYEYYSLLGLDNLQSKNNLHSTIIEFWIDESIPNSFYKKDINIDYKTFYHKFIKNKNSNLYTLLLCFKSEDINILHWDIRKKFNVKHRYRRFLPHLTIAYKLEESEIRNLPTPRFNIKLTNFTGNKAENIDFDAINDMF